MFAAGAALLGLILIIFGFYCLEEDKHVDNSARNGYRDITDPIREIPTVKPIDEQEK
jgi:hypothetical protein